METFQCDSCESEFSIVILDSLDPIIQYCPICAGDIMCTSTEDEAGDDE